MKYFSIREVAELLDVSYKTVKKEIDTLKLPAVRVGKMYRIAQTALNEYLSTAAYRPSPSLDLPEKSKRRLMPATKRRTQLFPKKA